MSDKITSRPWLQTLPDGRLRIGHDAGALAIRRREVQPLIRVMMAAYLVFWAVLALNGSFRQLLLDGPQALRVLVFALFAFGFGFPLFVSALLGQARREGILLDRAGGRYELLQARGLRLQRRSGSLSGLELRCLTLRESRTLGKETRQRWLQQLEIRDGGERPLTLGLQIEPLADGAHDKAPELPEAELAMIAAALGRAISWELGGNGVVTRQGQIAPGRSNTPE